LQSSETKRRGTLREASAFARDRELADPAFVVCVGSVWASRDVGIPDALIWFVACDHVMFWPTGNQQQGDPE
jgi:hypothetical protein